MTFDITEERKNFNQSVGENDRDSLLMKDQDVNN